MGRAATGTTKPRSAKYEAKVEAITDEFAPRTVCSASAVTSALQARLTGGAAKTETDVSEVRMEVRPCGDWRLVPSRKCVLAWRAAWAMV